MAILIGKYNPRETSMLYQLFTTSTHNGLSTHDRLRDYVKYCDGYQCIVKRGTSSVDDSRMDPDTTRIYEDHEIHKLLKDLAESTAYIKDNPSAYDRDELIDQAAAMSNAVYQFYTGMQVSS